MAKPIEDVKKACEICIAWAKYRPSHTECPYFGEENCEDALQNDVLFYLEQLKDIEQPKLPGVDDRS